MLEAILLTLLSTLLISLLPSIELLLHSLLYFKGTKLNENIRVSNQGLKERPLISIVMPVKNEPIELFERSLKSIANLKWPKNRLEVIIISDDPPKKAIELKNKIKEIANKASLNIVFINRENPHGGRSGALNDGLEIAKGKYLMTLDVDNIVDPDFLEKAIDLMENGSYSAVVARWKPLNTDTRVSQAQAYALDYLMDALYRGFKGLNLPVFPLGSGTVYRKDVLRKIGGWDENRIQDDMEIGSRLIGRGYKTSFIDCQGVHVELPPTVKALRVQQSRWSYGAMDALIARFSYIIRAPVPWYARLLYIGFLLQYTPVVGYIIGLPILFVAAYFSLVDKLLFFIITGIATVLASIYIYSFIHAHMVRNRRLKDIIVMLGRSSALVTFLSPWIAFYTLKALFRLPYKYKITPKGKEAYKKREGKISYSRIISIVLLTLSLLAYIVLLIVGKYVIIGMPYLLLAIAIIYSLIRWWKEI